MLLIISVLRFIFDYSEVVKSRASTDNFVSKVIFICPTLIFYNSVSLYPTNKVLNSDSNTGYGTVHVLLIFCQILALWFFSGLYDIDIYWGIPLIACILPKTETGWNMVIVGNTFIVDTTSVSRTDKQYDPKHRRNKRILNRMFLFFATILIFLEVFILRPWNFSFGAIVYQLLVFECFKNCLKFCIRSSRHALSTLQSQVQDGLKAVNIRVGLALLHVEKVRLNLLNRVVLEVEQDEAKAVPIAWKRATLVDHKPSKTTFFLPTNLVFAQILIVCLLKIW